MRKTIWGGAILTLLGALLIGVLSESTAARAEENPSTSEIMRKLNSKKGIHRAIEKAVKEPIVKWDELTKSAADYVALTEAMAKNKATAGDAASWAKLCKEYIQDAKSLAAAIEKKDKEKAQGAITKLNKSCAPCHDAHQE